MEVTIEKKYLSLNKVLEQIGYKNPSRERSKMITKHFHRNGTGNYPTIGPDQDRRILLEDALKFIQDETNVSDRLNIKAVLTILRRCE